MADSAALTERLRAAGISSPVRNLLLSLLSPDPTHRPHDGQALADAVVKCQRATAGRAKRKWPWLFAAIAALLLLVAGLAYVADLILFRSSTPKSIAVLPFDNLSPMGDKALFSDGVQDEILTNLATVADLQVISRSSVQVYRNPASRPLPPEIGRALNVNYLVNGSVERRISLWLGVDWRLLTIILTGIMRIVPRAGVALRRTLWIKPYA